MPKLKGISRILKSDKLKNIVKKIMGFISSHRLLSLLIVGAVVALVVILAIFGRKEVVVVQTQEKRKAPVTINRLEIIVPPGAFPTGKRFLIKEIPRDSERYRRIVERSNFLEEVYEVVPKDGREELALIPLTLRYRIPRKYYLGNDSFNLFLGYMKSDDDVLRRIYGCEMKEDDRGVYIEAKVFHTSIIGFSAGSPKEFVMGIRNMIERPPSYKPPVLIIPGIDGNFVGAIPKTRTNENPQGKNIWEFIFPDRSIWVYRYPLKSTRPKVYTDAAEAFFERNKRDYLIYEAKRLATELKRFPYKFDVVAHGIGGLLIRYAIESDPTVTNVRRVVLVDVPNLGTNLANPVYLNLLYGKSPDALAEIYGTDPDSIRFLVKNALDYLEKVNVFWVDLKPDSDFIHILNSFGLRKDVDYLAISGTTPSFTVRITGTELEKLYPEFIEGSGDGVVTTNSACYEGKMDCVKFPHSFSDIYLQPEVLDKIKEFLEGGLKEPEEYVFKDDTFIERTASPGCEILPTPTIVEEITETGTKAESKKSTKMLQLEISTGERYLPLNYQTNRIFEFPTERGKFRFLNSDYGIYVVMENEVTLLTDILSEPSSSIVYVGEKIHANMFDGKLYVLDSSGISVFDGDVRRKKIEVEVDIGMDDVVDTFMTDEKLIVLRRKGRNLELTEYPFDNMKMFKILKKFKGTGGHLRFDENTGTVLVITDYEIGKYDPAEDRYEILERSSELLRKMNDVKTRRLVFSDAILFNDLMFILTEEYEIYIENMKNGEVVRFGAGDVGSMKLLAGGRRIYILGNKTINFLELEGNKIRRFPGYIRARKDTIFRDMMVLLDDDGNERIVIGMEKKEKAVIGELEVFWR